jgi:hypothetical protein
VQTSLPLSAAPGTAEVLEAVKALLAARCRERHAAYLLKRERLVRGAEAALEVISGTPPVHANHDESLLTVH